MMMVKVDRYAIVCAIGALCEGLNAAVDEEDYDRIECDASTVAKLVQGITTPGREVEE